VGRSLFLKYDDNSIDSWNPLILWQISTTSSSQTEILLTVQNPGVSVVPVADEAHGTVGA
jgi:hypothetical protein